MGGHALSSTSVRLNKKNFEVVAAECEAQLKRLYPGKRISVLGSYRSKADFGDCDILVECGDHYDPQVAAIALGAVEVVRNGPVTSIGLVVDPTVATHENNMFQVDLVAIDLLAFNFALGYFGAGDAGNLLGRLYHSAGLAFRHDGLYYYFRDLENSDYKFREILLTQKFDEALSFMDYDPKVFQAGFDTQEDIYAYVASSSFFNSDIFLLHNRNAKSRVRDKKRAMYMNFLEWCKAHPYLTAYSYPEDKDVWLPRIAEFFPHFTAEYNKALSDIAELRAVKQKFNGELVSQITGLKGKELGAVMKHFKESFVSAKELRAFVLNSNFEEIVARVKLAQTGIV